jgi:glycosyltransferase involved in cell wall biosynthesis
MKIKVLHVHTLPVISGSGINTLLTMTGLDNNKYSVEFACSPGGPLVEEAIQSGVAFRPIKHLVQPVSIYHDILGLLELISLLRKHKYDIIHTHNSKAGFIGRLAAKIAGVPVIVHTIHGFSFHEFERPPRRALFLFLERFAALFADKLITISGPLKDWGLSLGIGKPWQYVTIYSGIEISKFNVNIDKEGLKRRLGILPGELVIGVVSKLWEGKGHRNILEATKEVLKEFPNLKLLIVGDGYLKPDLEKLIKQLNIEDRVIFTGFRKDIPELTSLFDVAILASFFEGMGRVLLEAMVLEKPVIGTRVGGIVDVVDEGKTGLLVPPNDSAALAVTMTTLLRNQELRVKMGRAAKQKIDEQFSAQNMVRKIEELYDELIR